MHQDFETGYLIMNLDIRKEKKGKDGLGGGLRVSPRCYTITEFVGVCEIFWKKCLQLSPGSEKGPLAPQPNLHP